MHFYLIGICGSAMGNLALLLKEKGHTVSGSDQAFYPPMSEHLRRAQIDFNEGYDLEHLLSAKPDKVIVGNAVTRGNPLVEYILEQRRLSFSSLPEALFSEILFERQRLVVAGTHGKTTTSSMLAWLLDTPGAPVGFLIGGLPRQFSGGSRLGAQEAPFVIEGDEYDSAFFDKRSKFIHYRPDILILNNLEFDHGDIFRDLEDIQRSFRHLLRTIPGSGTVIANGDDPNIRALLPVEWTTIFLVGKGEHNNLKLLGCEDNPGGASCVLQWQDETPCSLKLTLNGKFNLRNAAMALAAARLQPELPKTGSDWVQLVERASTFTGVRRRQEILFQSDKTVIIEDFGHHPTAIAETIKSLRLRFPNSSIAVCFEPRSNTSVTNRFETEFSEALGLADQIFIAPVHRGESIPKENRINPRTLINSSKIQGENGWFAETFKNLEDLLQQHWLQRAAKEGNSKKILCFFSNGSCGGVPNSIALLAETSVGSKKGAE